MTHQPPQADHREGRLRALAHRLAEEDPSPALPRAVRVAMTIGPLAGFGVMLLGVYLAYGAGAASFLTLAEVGSFVGGGKFVIFGGVPEAAPLGVWVLTYLVVYGDLATALIMMANMTVLYRTPFIGARLAAAHEAGWYVLHMHRWMRRTAWLGVAAFVAAPFQGTGAVVGTILARVLGLSRLATLLAMAFGSATGCLALALLGTYGRNRVKELAMHPLAAMVALGLAVVVIVVIGRWFTGQSLAASGATLPDDGDERREDPREKELR